MTKKLIITLCDADTGEIFASNKNTRFVPDDQLKKVVQQWTESFFRGLAQNRQLCISITVKNKSVVTMDDFFVDAQPSTIPPVVESLNCPF